MEPKDHYNYCYRYWKCWRYTSFMNLLYEFTGEVEFVSVSNSVSIRREWDNKTGSSLQIMAWDLFSFQTSFTHSETRRLNLLTQLCFWKHRFGCISKFRGSACAETNCTPDLIWFSSTIAIMFSYLWCPRYELTPALPLWTAVPLLKRRLVGLPAAVLVVEPEADETNPVLHVCKPVGRDVDATG